MSFILLCLVVPGLYNALKIVPYAVHADGISEPIRIALVRRVTPADMEKFRERFWMPLMNRLIDVMPK
jgi:hypothetical protein